MKHFIKIIYLIFVLLLCSCHSRQRVVHQNSLHVISESTMDRILVFMDKETQSSLLDQMMYFEKGTPNEEIPLLEEEGVYVANWKQEEDDAIISMLKEPAALSYLFSLPGISHKLGLTDCQDPYAMIQIDEKLRLKSYTLFSEEEIDKAYQKTVQLELDKIQCKNR